MARKAQYPPKLHRDRTRARVKWRGRWHDCGRWGTPGAEREYRRLLLVWRDNPDALVRRPGELLVSELCAAYQRAAPYAAGERVQYTRAIALLLDVHAETPVAEFGPLPQPVDPAVS